MDVVIAADVRYISASVSVEVAAQALVGLCFWATILVVIQVKIFALTLAIVGAVGYAVVVGVWEAIRKRLTW